jgi:hypothetical protein
MSPLLDLGFIVVRVLVFELIRLAVRGGDWLAARVEGSEAQAHAVAVEEQGRRIDTWARRQGLQWDAPCWHGSWNGHDLKVLQRKSGTSLSPVYVLIGSCLGPEAPVFPESCAPVWKALFLANPCVERVRSVGNDLELKMRWNTQAEELEAVFRSIANRS